MAKKKVKAKLKAKTKAKKTKSAVKKKKTAKKAPVSKKSTKGSRAIVWTVDPFGDLNEGLKISAKVAKMLADKTSSPIEPVYVLSPGGFNWAGDFSDAWVKKIQPQVEAKMNERLKELGLTTLPPKILVHKLLSLTGDTKKVIHHAKASGARMVLLATHARQGLSRFVLGSFAETAILNSEVPLMLVNPKCEVPQSLDRALFATDLSKSSKRGFKKFLGQVKGLTNSVVIYHKLPDPIEPVIQAGVQMAGGGWVTVQQFLNKEGQEREKECQQMADEAKKMGFDAKVILDRSPGFVTDTIVNEIKSHKIDFVAMVSKTGPISTVLIGSIGRQMARVSPVPVYLFHEKS
jgi:nucleotide-binding universal stress UspA family protein